MRTSPVVLAVAVMVGCKGAPPDRATYQTGWNVAVTNKDGAAVWQLLDDASRARITTALARSQAAAKGDVLVKALFAALNSPVDTAKPIDELARAMIGARLADGTGIDLADDATTSAIHLEHDRWVATAEPYGFATADGGGLTLSLALGNFHAASPPDGVRELDLAPPAIDRRDGSRLAPAAYTERLDGAAAAIVSTLHVPPTYSHDLTRIVHFFQAEHYIEVLPASPSGRDLVGQPHHRITADGSDTPILRTRAKDGFDTSDEPLPKLAYGTWPK